MNATRACFSCGQDSAYVRRVRCGRCGDQVHPTCRDITGTCYTCRYRQARAGGIDGTMLAPSAAGQEPFERNQPTTVTRSVELPGLYDEDTNRDGLALNVARIIHSAQYAGWHVEKRSELGSTFMLRKHGRGYLRIYFTIMGAVISAGSQRRNIYPANTARVLEYLEGDR
ncbi:hypothetical protein ACPCSE_29235 [Streptomyces cellulosae]